MERGQENPVRNVTEGHPEVIPLPFHLKEVKKDINRRCTTQKPEKDVESLDKSPAIRIQLGRSSVDLCQQFLLKPGEGQAHADGLENHLIELKEGDPVVGPFVSAHWLP